MKNLLFIFLLALTGLFPNTMYSKSSDKEATFNSNTQTKHVTLSRADIERMTKRVNEIKEMDKRNLTPAQKTELKTELNVMKSQISNANPLFYFVLGALVAAIAIIALLL